MNLLALTTPVITDAASAQSFVTGELTEWGPVAVAVVGVGIGLSFVVKGLWVAHRAGSKAIGKIGS